MLALTALVLFAANAFIVRGASLRLGQQVGFLVALVADVAFGSVLVAVDAAARSSRLELDWAVIAQFASRGCFPAISGGVVTSVQWRR